MMTEKINRTILCCTVYCRCVRVCFFSKLECSCFVFYVFCTFSFCLLLGLTPSSRLLFEFEYSSQSSVTKLRNKYRKLTYL